MVLEARLGCAEASGASARGVAEVGVFWILESLGLGPLGSQPQSLLLVQRLWARFGMRVGLCCAGCLSLHVGARIYINWMYGGGESERGWIVASHRIASHLIYLGCV